MKTEKLKIERNVILAPYTSFGIGGVADYFVQVKEPGQIIGVVRWAKAKKIPFKILGGGSNILVSDKGIRGLVIKLVNGQWSMVNGLLVCDAGCPAHLLAIQTAKKGLSGLHWFAGLPGTVGGALYKNSHWGVHCFSDNLIELEVINENLKLKKIKKSRLKFGYNRSNFQKNKAIIISAKFQLQKGKPEELQMEIRNILNRRQENHPQERSAGCVFKNVNGRSAGRLIEQAGLKGKMIGDAQISTKHANFFVNKGKAKSSQVMGLIKLVQKEAIKKLNIELEPEIYFWGEF